MTQLCWNRHCIKHSHWNIPDCHRRHIGYGVTDYPDNDSLGDEALPLPFWWTRQSFVETLRGKHGGFNVGRC